MKKPAAETPAKVSMKKVSPAAPAPVSMKKVSAAAPAPAKPKAPAKAKVLYGECDPKVLAQQSALMESEGYEVRQVLGRRGVEEELRQGKYDVVVLGHTMTRDDRHHLPYMAKQVNSDLLVMVIHASGKHPQVDAVVDSRFGENALLECLTGLLELVPA